VKTRLPAVLCALASLTALAAAKAPKAPPAPPLSTMAPADLTGAPELKPGTEKVFYVWVEPKAVHLRFISDGKPVLFSGSLELDKNLGTFTRINANAGGWLQNHGDRNLMFSSTAMKEADGFDLVVPPGSTAKLDLQIDGKPAEVEQVGFGAAKAHPKSVPVKFVIK
jgi:hypothetical protein